MIGRIIALVLAALVSACASPTPYVSESFTVTGNVLNLGGGREIALVEFCKHVTKLTAKEQEEIRKNPSLKRCEELQMQSAFGTDVARDIVTSASAAVLGAIVQGQVAERVAVKQARICGADGSGCGKGGGSASSSGAGANATVTLNLSCGKDCGK